MSFKVQVDVRNPGQYFACCGLLELAFRLTGHAKARFQGAYFLVESECTLADLLSKFAHAPILQVDSEDDASSPIRIPAPFDLLIDWWKDEASGGKQLKVWAGTMQSVRIASAMVAALRDLKFQDEALFNEGCIVYDPADPTKKVEPFYFDARRSQNAHSRDVGFSPNDLSLTTTAFPAVESLCLIGLQRFRPASTDRKRIFEYRTWAGLLPIAVIPPLISGLVPFADTRKFRFENWYRTSQKKHKAFRPAVPIAQGE